MLVSASWGLLARFGTGPWMRLLPLHPLWLHPWLAHNIQRGQIYKKMAYVHYWKYAVWVQIGFSSKQCLV